MQRLSSSGRGWWGALCGAVLTLCGLSRDSARADGEFTRWGMTQEEARQAGANFGLHPAVSDDDYNCSNSYGRVIFKAPYELEDVTATACLLFDRDTGFLREIMIPLPAPIRKQRVAELITKTYGQPSKTEELMPGLMVSTIWVAPEYRITLRSTGDLNTLVFAPPEDQIGDGW